MQDRITRNNQVDNTITGILESESPNNQIYDNIIELASSRRSASLNPELPDDVFTGYNAVYNNIISDSDDGIRATRSQSNTLENNTLCNISSNEYNL